MALIDWLRRLLRIKQPRVSYMLPLAIGGISGAANTEAYLKAYGEIGWLFACVSRIGFAVGEAEWELVSRRNGDEKPLENHVLLGLIHKPNKFFTGQDLLEYTQMHLDLTGEAFWIKNINRIGQAGELWPVPPNRMRIIPSKKEFIAGYLYRYGGETVPFLPEEVIHFKYPNPLSMYRGLGPVQALAVDLDTENFASKWNRNFFLNSARPDAVLMTDGAVTDHQMRELREAWQAGHQGVERAHRVAVLERNLKYEQVSITQQEMGFIDQRKLNRDIILAGFGIPLHILGISETTNRATAESAEYVFARWVIRPRLQRLMHKLNEELVPAFGEGLALRYVDPTPENREEARLDAESGMQAGYMTINEARQLMGLEAIPLGEVLILPLMSTPVPVDALEGRTPPPMLSAAYRVLPSLKGLSDEAKERLGEAFVRRVTRRERPFKLAMMGFYEAQERTILQGLDEIAERQLGAELYDDIYWLGELRKLGRPLITVILREAAKDAIADYALGIDFNLSNPRVQHWIGDRLRKFSTSINDTQKEGIIAQLREAEAAGESIRQMQDRIVGYYDGKEYWAERTARTEVVYASNQGAIESYAQAGIEKWEWLVTGDNRLCQDCIDRVEGSPYPISVPFEPPHPQCRCDAIPVLLEEES